MAEEFLQGEFTSFRKGIQESVGSHGSEMVRKSLRNMDCLKQ